MNVSTSRVVLHLPQSRSLKDKRQIVKAILQRARNLGVAAAEEVVRMIESGPWEAWITHDERDAWTST